MPRVMLISVLLCLITSCAQGQQRGQYSVSGNKTVSLSNARGFATVFRGHALSKDGSVIGGEKTLLALLVLAPGQPPGDSSPENHVHEKTVTRIERLWSLNPREGFQAKWDRREDIVYIGDEAFNRKDGNMFFVVCGLDNAPVVHQIPGVQENMEVGSLIDVIKAKLPEQKSLLGKLKLEVVQ
jgi:hypothetical protein